MKYSWKYRSGSLVLFYLHFLCCGHTAARRQFNDDLTPQRVHLEDVNTNEEQYDSQYARVPFEEQYVPEEQFIQLPQVYNVREQQLPHYEPPSHQESTSTGVINEEEEVQPQQSGQQAYSYQEFSLGGLPAASNQLNLPQADNTRESFTLYNPGANSANTHIPNEHDIEVALADDLRPPASPEPTQPYQQQYSHQQPQSQAQAKDFGYDQQQEQQQLQQQQQQQHEQRAFDYNGRGGISDGHHTQVFTYHRHAFPTTVEYDTPPTGAQATAVAQVTPFNLDFASAGVKYVANNDIEEPIVDLPSRQYLPLPAVSIPRPMQTYGPPVECFKQRSQSQPISNQLAFAPERSEPRTLAFSAATIPFPPSFISITTERPIAGNHIESQYETNDQSHSHSHSQSPSSARGQFRPSPVDPLPDLFANRQAKSLLDSYIPSWVVTKLLQQRFGTPYSYYGKYKRNSATASNGQAKKLTKHQ